MKLRIAAAAIIGIVFVSIIAWPWEMPPDPLGDVLIKAIGINGAVTLLVMAFLAGLIAYFATWPYGIEIGVLAVPFGLAVWAIRAGSVGNLMQINSTLAQRQALLATLRWEPMFWFLVVVAGFAGVILGQKIRPSHKSKETQEVDKSVSYKYLNPIIALAVTVLIAQVGIKIIAQDDKLATVGG